MDKVQLEREKHFGAAMAIASAAMETSSPFFMQLIHLSL